MSDTLDLFTDRMTQPYRGEPPHNGVETSIEAAESVKGGLSRLEKLVYDFIAERRHYGATSDEVESGLNMRHQTVSARIRTLYLKERLTKTETKRKTRSGRGAFVYVAREGA